MALICASVRGGEFLHGCNILNGTFNLCGRVVGNVFHAAGLVHYLYGSCRGW